MTIEEINQLVDRFSKWAKKKYQKYSKPDAEMEELWPGQKYAIEQLEAIQPHAEITAFPEKLYTKRAPNQSPDELKWMRENYKAVTLPVFMDYVNTTSRALADNNWALDYNSNDPLKEYAESAQATAVGSVESYFKTIIPAIKGKDANGIIAIQPNELATETIEGEIRLSNEPQKVHPVYYSSRHIIAQKMGVYYGVISYEKTAAGLMVLLFFDDQYIWKVEQQSPKEKWKFSEPYIWFQHGLGYVPCEKLKGIPQLVQDALMFNSPFYYAVDNLDLVLLDQSYLQASKSKCVFPYQVAIGMPCDFENQTGKCDAGMLYDSKGIQLGTCPSCSGSGVKSRITPLGSLLINPSMLSGENSIDPSKALQFVSPDTKTLEFLETQKSENEKRARKILHLADSDGQVSIAEAHTATGSLNNLRATYAFIKPISDQMFDLYEFMLNTIGKMRDVNSQPVALTPPNTFDIQTPQELLLEISAAQKLGAPPAIIYQLINAYVQTIYITNEMAMKALALLNTVDVLLTSSEQQVAQAVAQGIVTKEQVIIHIAGMQLLQELTLANERFFEQPVETQIEQLRAKAAELVPAPEIEGQIQALLNLGT
jgi:hypothetical protein